MYPAPFASYVLLERLGTGGMSEVDLARRSVDDAGYVRLVVIKRIKADRSADTSFVRMFKDEARITAELDHPSIGRVYDFGRQGDEYYLVLEYVPGIDLRQLIVDLAERRERVPIRFALGILVHVLEALEHAHRMRDPAGRPRKIVHRDVNPRNVMVSIRGQVKLIDFGVAFATDRLERTRTDHVKGKFSYMAPEQIAGKPVDHRADLYAVGLTLWELLTGQGPFAGLNQVQILHRMLSGEPPRMPDLPELADPAPLAAVHARALAKEPAARFQSAAEFREALLDALAPLGGVPTEDEIAGFLRRASPAAIERIERKLAAYAQGEVLPPTRSDIPVGAVATYPGLSPDSSTIDPQPVPQRPPMPASQADTTLGAARVLAGGAFVGAIGGLAVLLALVAVTAVAAAVWLALASEPGPQPAPQSPAGRLGE